MLNPDPKKFTDLPEAFNALGQNRFGDKWTGAELTARNLPSPKDTFRALEDAENVRARTHQELDHGRRTKVEKAKEAAVGVGGGVRITHRPRGGPPTSKALEQEQLVEVARHAHLDPEIAKAASNQIAYRKKCQARTRRDKTENELRKLLHGKHVPATLLNNHDGKLIDIPPPHWLADKFTVDFATGRAGWTNLDGEQRVTYQGIILIDRRDFDRLVMANQRPRVLPDDKEGQEGKPRPTVQKRAKRKSDTETDAILRIKIKKVLAAARRESPDAKKRPGIKPMAKELVREHRGNLDYKFYTVCKILDGTYKSSRRLGIPGV